MSLLDLLSTVPAWASVIALVAVPLFAYSLGVAVGAARAERGLDRLYTRLATEINLARRDVIEVVRDRRAA